MAHRPFPTRPAYPAPRVTSPQLRSKLSKALLTLPKLSDILPHVGYSAFKALVLDACWRSHGSPPHNCWQGCTHAAAVSQPQSAASGTPSCLENTSWSAVGTDTRMLASPSSANPTTSRCCFCWERFEYKGTMLG